MQLILGQLRVPGPGTCLVHVPLRYVQNSKNQKKSNGQKVTQKVTQKSDFVFCEQGSTRVVPTTPGEVGNAGTMRTLAATGPATPGCSRTGQHAENYPKNWIYILDIYRLGVNVYRKNIDTFLFISESRLCWRTTEIELGTEVHSPGIFVRNERIPKKNRHSGSVLRSYGFFGMGYFYHLVAGANLVDKKKVHFTLVQHRVPL